MSMNQADQKLNPEAAASFMGAMEEQARRASKQVTYLLARGVEIGCEYRPPMHRGRPSRKARIVEDESIDFVWMLFTTELRRRHQEFGYIDKADQGWELISRGEALRLLEGEDVETLQQRQAAESDAIFAKLRP